MPLTNALRLGFHPVGELHIGNPHVPRTYDVHPLSFDIFSDNLVDDQPYNSYSRADLCLVYVYEVATEYLLGGERIILPIIHRVYRRDAELRWSEIRIALAGGRFPARYQHTEPNIAPMNHAMFQKFIDRFYLADHDGDDQTIFEKGTHLPVQKQHEDYEQILQLMLPIIYSEAELFRFLPDEIAQAALEHRDMWHLDRLARATIFWRTLHA
ncbi:hypothetical protein K438DRAFT_1987398 [Mycena galopus ATCC 62051]|nr:hypothetical protein K438DRAFT_1987398 [Mycena galopus ATCC 62051]